MKTNTILKCCFLEVIGVLIFCWYIILGLSLGVMSLITVGTVLAVIFTILNIRLAYEDLKAEAVHFCLLDSDAMLPEKRREDAGYDVYACFRGDWMNIRPHETVMIPTGIASVFDEKYVAVLKERGSTGTKGMGQRCGVLDSGYRNEWFVPITNHNDIPIVILKEDAEDKWLEEIEMHGLTKEDFIIYPYNKAVCQMLLLPVPDVEIVEISKEQLEAAKSERGQGRLGSSGK